MSNEMSNGLEHASVHVEANMDRLMDGTDHPDQESSQKLSKSIVNIVQVNITNWSEQARIFVSEQFDLGVEIMMISEHKLLGAALYKQVQHLRKRWFVFYSAAAIRQSQPGGGVFLLVRRTCAVQTSEIKSHGDDWCACILKTRHISICLISVYIHCDPLSEALTQLKQISDFVAQHALPFICAGDYNKNPRELHDLQWEPLVQGGLVKAPDGVEATCSAGPGNLLDYAVVSKEINGTYLTCEPMLEVPFPTHIGVKHVIRVSVQDLVVRALLKPKPFPRKENSDLIQEPQDWKSAKINAMFLIRPDTILRDIQRDVFEYAAETQTLADSTELGQAYMLWSRTREHQILSQTPDIENPKYYMGRGG